MLIVYNCYIKQYDYNGRIFKKYEDEYRCVVLWKMCRT